jgi:hypothetical protein
MTSNLHPIIAAALAPHMTAGGPRSLPLTADEAAIAKALLACGWLQHDVASLLSCNAGRVAEVWTGARHASVAPADLADPATATTLADLSARMFTRIAALVAATLDTTKTGDAA